MMDIETTTRIRDLLDIKEIVLDWDDLVTKHEQNKDFRDSEMCKDIYQTRCTVMEAHASVTD
jgi:hypothetical protein